MSLARTTTTYALDRRLAVGHIGHVAWSVLFTFFTFIFTSVASLGAGYPAGRAHIEALVVISRCAFENDLPIFWVNDAPVEKPLLPIWQVVLLSLPPHS